MKRQQISFLLPVGLLVLGLGFGGCALDESVASEGGRAAREESPNKSGEDAIAVAAVPLVRGRIESVLSYSTNLEAESEVEVFSQASRRVTELLVEEGHSVEKGQVLLRLQDDVQRSALAKAESQLAKASHEYERQKRLYDQELISEQVFTDATYELEQLEIALADADRLLEYTVVEAPIAGVVTERLVNLGDHVQENQRLFDIVDFDSIVARIYVPEKELLRLRPGQPARIAAQSAGGARFDGSIDRIAPTVDPKSGTVKVTLAVARRPQLRPGMYVEVELVAEVDEAALLVPKRALVYDQDQVFVFRVGAGERAERRLIRPLIEDRDFVKVEGTLAEGDRVVVAGQAGLKDGSEVRLVDLDDALGTFGGPQVSGRAP